MNTEDSKNEYSREEVLRVQREQVKVLIQGTPAGEFYEDEYIEEFMCGVFGGTEYLDRIDLAWGRYKEARKLSALYDALGGSAISMLSEIISAKRLDYETCEEEERDNQGGESPLEDDQEEEVLQEWVSQRREELSDEINYASNALEKAYGEISDNTWHLVRR